MTKSDIMKEANRRVALKCASDRAKGYAITRRDMARYLRFHLRAVWAERPRTPAAPLTPAEKMAVDLLRQQRDCQPVTTTGNSTWEQVNRQIQTLTWGRA